MLYLDNQVSHDDTIQLSRIYLHGSLENQLGYDLLRTDDIRLYNKIYNTYHKDEGFNCCEKLSSNGVVFDVDIFIWRHNEMGWQGLVCDSNNIEDYRDCFEKYKTRMQFL